jgi:DNA-binding GntR family transcriptional regulator
MAPGQPLAGEGPAGKVVVTRASPGAALSDLAADRLAGRIPGRGARVRAVSPAEAGPAP